MLDKKPKVSVCVVTYNQQEYIRQCLQSIVEQVTNFSFEIIVGDDCSTDNTRMIVNEMASIYPELIKPLFQSENLGAVGNYFATHDCANGEYIAHLDGDDLMLPGKIQQQADFLDKHDDFKIVWHRVKYLYDDGINLDDLVEFEEIRDGYNRNDLIRYTFLANHSTKMYRSSQRKYCKKVSNTMDYFLNIEQVQSGRAGYVGKQILGVYRHGIGVSSNKNAVFRNYLLDQLAVMAKDSSKDHEAINNAAFVLMAADLKNGNSTLTKSMRLWFTTFSISAMKHYYFCSKRRRMYSAPR